MPNPFYTNQVEVLPFVEFVFHHPEIAQKRRFKVFEAIGYDCVSCGLIGSHWVWWRENGEQAKDHWDLAGYNEEGTLIMITIDHIHPRSKGGSDSIDNYQPMCAPCNSKKADKLPVEKK